jgi:hypothetical protein
MGVTRFRIDAPAAFFVKTVAAILFLTSDMIAPGVNLAILRRFCNVNSEGIRFKLEFNRVAANRFLIGFWSGDWLQSKSPG